MFHADGQTNMTQLTVAFPNSTNAPKKGCNVVFDSIQLSLVKRGSQPPQHKS
jgi:hypothetical protein